MSLRSKVINYRKSLFNLSKEDDESKQVYRGYFKLVKEFKDYKVDLIKAYIGDLDTKSKKYAAAVALLFSDMIFNVLLLNFGRGALSAMSDQILDRIYTYQGKTKFTDCLIRRLPFLPYSAAAGFVAAFTEESSKWAAKELGVLKEYVAIFVLVENYSYSKMSIKQALTNLRLKLRFSSKHDGLILIKVVFRKTKDFIIKNTDKGFQKLIYHVTFKDVLNQQVSVEYFAGKEYGVSLSSHLIVRWGIGTFLHSLFGVLHKYGLHRTAITFHLLFNMFLSLAVECLTFRPVRS